jgi:biopolymer transport protein ExbB
MWDIVQAAGWPIWFLILASIVSMALILERSRTLRAELVIPATALPAALLLLNDTEDVSNSLAQLAQQGSLGAVLAAGVQAARVAQSSPVEVQNAMDDALHFESHTLNQYLPALGTVAAVAPLLGLFGTVIGMIETFGAQTPAGMNPAQLAHGISVALYNTAMGIFVAIVALIAYRVLRSKAESFVLAIDRTSSTLVNTALTKAAS